MTEQLALKDTNVLKGIAILLMLIHHLFWVQKGLFDDIRLFGLHYLVNEIGIISKVCVSIFVLLSGYGLTVVAEKNGGIGSLKSFYFHRFKKLFLNYWFVWVLFVPISIYVFGYTLADAYHGRVISHLLADLSGIHSLIYENDYCYNPTWWFYSCIILLYLFFPFLYRWAKRDVVSLLLMSIAASFLPIPQLTVIKFYIVAFVIGMIMVVRMIPSPNNVILPIVVFVVLIVVRNFNSYPLLIDTFISVALVQLYRSIKLHEWICVGLSFVGKHSMNIFLFHTFIFYFWFQDIVYASRNPIIIFFTLLAICILISMALELIKKYTIYKL